MAMARALIAALLLLMLAACGRGELLGPFAESRTPPAIGPRFFAPEGWTWGFVQTGGRPIQRYGVATTWRAPRATVVILPGYGESAEVWFETVGALTRRGYTVWVLDRAGQGGSARYTLPRDLGYAPSFDPDVATLKGLVKVVIRPQPGTPLILLGHADGAVVALRAAETGLRVDGVIASSPNLATRAVSQDTAQAWAGRIPLLGRLPNAGWRPWSRSQPDERERGRTHDLWRGALAKAWQTANPDLRMSEPSLGWRGAHQAASRQAQTDAGRIPVPVLVITAGGADAQTTALCKALRHCSPLAIPGARPDLHLESETWRAPWFAAVTAFIADKVDASRAVAMPRAAANSPDNSEALEEDRPKDH
ncbi:alpha/beta fold hydrolase [Phenylobacterium aquaticum]|uniref:alpha/beta fold hydrolase n=1 Tax=Phenylobacterium aquaticum TaxID=1763816 RepID=UPI0026EDFB8F|nr:alpha/beta hydrolase [Phenylobacterium aquaticum]